MPYASLALPLRGVLGLFAFLLFLLLAYNVIRCLELGLGAKRTAADGLLLATGLLLFALLNAAISGEAGQALIPFAGQIPAPVYLGALAILTAAALFRLRGVLTLERRSLSVTSVKQSLDHLPTGVLFYFPGGLTKLVNEAMERTARELTGQPVRNGAEFWQTVSEGELAGRLAGGETPIVRLPDGSAVGFRRYETTLDGRLLYEVIAADLTEEVRLNSELREKQERVRLVNVRLKALMGRIKYTVMEREAAEMRARIHDRFGHALLHARRYVREPEEADRKELLEEWRGTIRPLLAETQGDWQTPFDSMTEEAEALGIRLMIDGELPREAHLRALVGTAVSVHLANVLRHAEGTEATVRIRETAGEYEVTFENNGRPPFGPIRETGGLRNLRAEAERNGGTLAIAAEPAFRMTLKLPKEEPNDAL